MPSKTGKTPASYYKSDVSVDQSTNVGFDSNTRSIISGDGAKSSISLSDDVLSVQPVNDDSVGSLLVKSQGGSNILAVDTTNSKVLVGASQVASNTFYINFGNTSGETAAYSANTHYPLVFSTGKYSNVLAAQLPAFGTGTDPDTTFTTADANSYRASDIVPLLWYVHDAITLDAIISTEGADAATGDTTRMHLFSYDFTSGSTSCLTAGTLLAHNSDVANAGSEQPYLTTWTIDSADVAAGKVILAFFRSDSVNSDYSINIQIKAHIQ